MSSHSKDKPSDWSQAVTNGYVKDPGARDLTDPTWVHRNAEYIASLPQANYSKGSGEGHNNG